MSVIQNNAIPQVLSLQTLLTCEDAKKLRPQKLYICPSLFINSLICLCSSLQQLCYQKYCKKLQTAAKQFNWGNCYTRAIFAAGLGWTRFIKNLSRGNLAISGPFLEGNVYLGLGFPKGKSMQRETTCICYNYTGVRIACISE